MAPKGNRKIRKKMCDFRVLTAVSEVMTHQWCSKWIWASGKVSLHAILATFGRPIIFESGQFRYLSSMKNCHFQNLANSTSNLGHTLSKRGENLSFYPQKKSQKFHILFRFIICLLFEIYNAIVYILKQFSKDCLS